MPRGVSLYDEARLQRRLWTPRILGVDNRLQVEPFDISTLSGSGSTITQARDKSPNGLGFINSGSPPSLVNGCLNFNGSQYIYTRAIDILSPDVWSSGIFCLIMYYTSGTVLFKLQGSGTRIGFEGSNRVDWSNDSTGKLQGWTSTLSSTPKLVTVRKTASGKIVRINGVQVASQSETTTMGTGTTPFVLGANDTGGGLAATCGFGFVGFSSDISDRAMFNLEGYVAWAFQNSTFQTRRLVDDLSGNHPFKNRPPLIGD